MVAPSVNSTIECTIDCGWTTTSMRSYPTPNSSWASITSRPLFMRVDESTVIFGPIFHVGWARASSMVTDASSARLRPRNGPPLAVSTIRCTRSGRPPPQRLQALVDRAVLAVDRDQLGAGGLPHPRDHRPAGDQRLLVGQREAPPGGQRRQGDAQAGEADDAVDAHVGLGAQAGEALLPDPQLARRERRLELVEVGAVGHRHHRRAEAGRLRSQRGDVAAAGAERDDPEPVGLGVDDVDGLGADRAGRAGQRDGGGQPPNGPSSKNTAA